MKNFSFMIASNLVKKQMYNQNPQNCNNIMNSHQFKFALFDKNGKKIIGDNFKSNGLYIIDNTPLGHMGVWSIIVKYDKVSQR